VDLRHAVRNQVARHLVFLPLAKRKYPLHVLDRSTDIVIDGFTRSATTFAVVAFQLAQNGRVRVAHHVHAPIHLVRAAQLAIPTLVTAREPEGTILSAMAVHPEVSPRQWLQTYCRFYRRVLPYRESMVVATFDEVIHDLGSVIFRVNDRFGTAFKPFFHTSQTEAEVFEIIETRSKAPPWEDVIGQFLSGRISADRYRGAVKMLVAEGPVPEIPERRVQRPSPLREVRKEGLRARLEQPDLAGLRVQAARIYEAFVESAPTTCS